MPKKDEERRIVQLNAMDALLMDEIAKKDTGKTMSKYKSTSWFVAMDFKNDADLDNDYGTKSFPLSRIAVLDANRKIPSYMLPSYVDDMMFGNMTYEDGHYCFTTTDQGETVKYGCPEQLEGETEPLVNVIYVDNISSTDDYIEYRYDSTNKVFVVIPQSLKLVDGEGTHVSYTGSVGSDVYKQQVDLVLGDPAEATGTTILELKDSKLIHTTSGVTAGSYGTVTSPTLGFGSSFNVPYFTVNDTGHVTASKNVLVKVPDTAATSDVFGLVKLGTTASWLGASNDPGTSTEVARADHVHGSSSLSFGASNIFTYSPSSTSDSTVTSNVLLNVARGTVDVPMLTAYFGTITDGEVPTYEYSTNIINADLKETVNNGTMLLAGSSIGVGLDSTSSKTGVVLGNTPNMTLLLAQNSSYCTVLSAFDGSSDKPVAPVSIALNRITSENKVHRIIGFRNWWETDTHVNSVIVGDSTISENVVSFLMGDDSGEKSISFKFTPINKKATIIMPDSENYSETGTIEAGSVLYTDYVDDDTDETEVRLLWKKLDDILPISYLTATTTGTVKTAVAGGSTTLSLPDSYKTNDLEISSDSIQYLPFDKPISFTLGLALQASKFDSEKTVMRVYANLENDDGETDTVTVGKISADMSDEGWQFFDLSLKFKSALTGYGKMSVIFENNDDKIPVSIQVTHLSVNNIM